jgi:hypothetical protein
MAGADDRQVLAGGALAGASALSVLAMAHHPASFADAHLAGAVHGAMMVFVVVSLAGYASFARAHGLKRFAVASGLGFYAAGAFGNLLAATVNGFVTPALAARGGVGEDVFAFAWALNQTLTYGAVYATAAAFTLWGLDLVARGGRLTGIAALAAGIVPAFLLASGALNMHVAGAFLIYALFAAFGVILGIRMMAAPAPARRFASGRRPEE